MPSHHQRERMYRSAKWTCAYLMSVKLQLMTVLPRMASAAPNAIEYMDVPQNQHKYLLYTHKNHNSNCPPPPGVRWRSMGTVSTAAGVTSVSDSTGVFTTRYAAYSHASGQNTGIKPALHKLSTGYTLRPVRTKDGEWTPAGGLIQRNKRADQTCGGVF